MGNCQAIDAATLVIQHPSGKVDQMYWPVPASEIMKINPGHYVALLITTTICHTTTTTTTAATASATTKTDNTTSTTAAATTNSTGKTTSKSKNSSQKNSNSNSNKKGSDNKSNSSTGNSRNSVRITRVKLLRPTDTLALGHVYRLISTQEVMKGMVAKKQAKMRKSGIELADSEALKEVEKLARKSQLEKSHQVNNRHGNGHRSRTTSTPNGAIARPRTWQPSLHSISEAAS